MTQNSLGVHSGSSDYSQRLASQNWQTETILDGTILDNLRPLNFGLATARRCALVGQIGMAATRGDGYVYLTLT